MNTLLDLLEPGLGEGLWTIRPEHVVVGYGEHRGRVIEAVYRGTHLRLILDWQGQRVEALVDAGSAPAAGTEVAFALPEGNLWKVDEPEAQPRMSTSSKKAARANQN